MITPPDAAAVPDDSLPIDPAAGIDNINHVIFVVQENRSFDDYFGTFPGADGIPMKRRRARPPAPPIRRRAVRSPVPRHRRSIDGGGPHGQVASEIDINGGKMDGFVKAFAAGRWQVREASQGAALPAGQTRTSGTA